MLRLRFRGRAFSGMGKGKYYVGHPEYQKRFEGTLGYRPYPGTLNVKLERSEELERMRELRGLKGVAIAGFTVQGENMSALKCFEGELKGRRVTLLLIDVTHYNESVAELISPVYLRGELGINDGEELEFEVEVQDPAPGSH